MSECMHGYSPGHCALCDHAPGECDYGTCQQPAVCLVGYTWEWRPMCAKHAARVMGWDARLRVRTGRAGDNE